MVRTLHFEDDSTIPRLKSSENLLIGAVNLRRSLRPERLSALPNGFWGD